MRNSIFEVFNIDNTKYRTVIRILFVFLILLDLAIVFKPLGNSDFESYFNWSEKVLESIQENDIDKMDVLMHNIPITKGHIIYLVSNFVVKMIELFGITLYCGIFIKGHREDKSLIGIPWSRLIGRFIVLSVFISVVILPVSFFAISLFLLFIFALPYVIMFPACFMSGDSGLFKSFDQAIKKNKGFYLLNLKNISLLFVINFILSLVVTLVSFASETVGYVLNSFIGIWFLFAIGRYMGMTYCHIVENRPVQTYDKTK